MINIRPVLTREQAIDAAVRLFPKHIAAFRETLSDYLSRLEKLDGMEFALLSSMFSGPERAQISVEFRRMMAEAA